MRITQFANPSPLLCAGCSPSGPLRDDLVHNDPVHDGDPSTTTATIQPLPTVDLQDQLVWFGPNMGSDRETSWG